MRPGPLRESLDDCAGHLLNRHLAHAKEWFPHELVPGNSGGGSSLERSLNPRETPLPAGVSSALLVNLLTEDNLPHYFHAIAASRWHGFRVGRVEP